MSLKVKLVRDFDEFLKLEQPWNELVSQTEVDHAFMKHEWFECWIDNLGRRDNLFIQTGWKGGQLVAIAPLRIDRQHAKGFPAKVLSFLASSISPRCNFIVHDSIENEKFFDSIFQIRGSDLIITAGMEAGLNITKGYIRYLRENKKGKLTIEQGRRSPFLLVETRWEDYARTLSRNFRKSLNAHLRRVERAGSYEVTKITSYEAFLKVLNEIVETSSRSWKAKAEADLRSVPNLIPFYKEFSRKGVKKQLFELWVLRINGTVAAFTYAVRGNRSLSLIRMDFDEAYKDYGPGNGLGVFILKDLYERDGVWEYDFGGMDYGHKMSWTKSVREHVSITASSGNLYGNLLMFGKAKLLPLVRKLKGQAAPGGGETTPSSGPETSVR